MHQSRYVNQTQPRVNYLIRPLEQSLGILLLSRLNHDDRHLVDLMVVQEILQRQKDEIPLEMIVAANKLPGTQYIIIIIIMHQSRYVNQTQPSVNHLIRPLEQSLGILLLSRLNHDDRHLVDLMVVQEILQRQKDEIPLEMIVAANKLPGTQYIIIIIIMHQSRYVNQTQPSVNHLIRPLEQSLGILLL